jgi:hypothetical protein
VGHVRLRGAIVGEREGAVCSAVSCEWRRSSFALTMKMINKRAREVYTVEYGSNVFVVTRNRR